MIENSTALQTATLISSGTYGATSFEVVEYADAARSDVTYVLTWTDGVVNEWEETYGDLAVALARVAAIIRCVTSEGELSFADDAAEFAPKAETFLGAVLEP